MDVFIYFYSRLPFALDKVEDHLKGRLHPWGRVSGSGTGRTGSNVDLEILENSVGGATVLEEVRRALSELRVPPDTTIVIGDTTFNVYR